MLPVELHSERVRLVAPTLEDVADLAKACSNEDILFVLNKQRYTEDDRPCRVKDLLTA